MNSRLKGSVEPTIRRKLPHCFPILLMGNNDKRMLRQMRTGFLSNKTVNASQWNKLDKIQLQM